jgi:hypothetical protein
MKKGPLTQAAPGSGQHLNLARQDKPAASTPQPRGLRCAGCGAPGSPPTICTPSSTGVVLVPVFGARADGGPALLCDACRGGRRA